MLLVREMNLKLITSKEGFLLYKKRLIFCRENQPDTQITHTHYNFVEKLLSLQKKRALEISPEQTNALVLLVPIGVIQNFLFCKTTFLLCLCY